MLFIAGASVSCGGGETGPSENGGADEPTPGTMTAVVDGVAFTADDAKAGVITCPGRANFIDVSGRGTVAGQFGFVNVGVRGPAAGVSYQVPNWRGLVIRDGDTGETLYPGSSGTLMVTSLTSERISGEFEFVIAGPPGRTATVTSGEFDAPIDPNPVESCNTGGA